MTAKVFTRYSIGLALAAVLSGCLGGFKTVGETATKSSNFNPWAQGTVTSSSFSDEANSATTTPTCSIYVPAVIGQDQELRIVVMSRGLAQFQVSVNGSEYIALPTTNGTISWAANLFDAGTYNLKFRGLLANNSNMTCDPENKTLTIYAVESSTPTGPTVPTVPTPTPNPSPSPTPSPTNPPSQPSNSGATVDRNYTALVGINGAYRGFKDIYNPTNLTKMDIDPAFAPGEKCYHLSTRHGHEVLRSLSSTQYRFFIPPGTKSFTMIALTYYDSVTTQAITMKLNSAPTSNYEYVVANHQTSTLGRESLEQLFGGAEVFGIVGPNANVLPGFPGKGTGTDHSVRYLYKAPRAGWLYVNHLRVIGGVSMLLTTTTCVDPTDYENWYRNAQWDGDGNPL